MKNNWLISLWSIFATSLVVYVIGLNVDVMDIDAAQYASIALEMVNRQDFLTVTERGADYLDKPPLVFWLCAWSFKWFGAGTVAYKLPSFLFSLLTFFSTYKLARAFYDKEVALLAVVITATSQAFFMINNDCRTDTVLTGAILFSIYQLVYYTRTKQTTYLLGSFVAVGLAMLAKGPVGLVIPFAIVGLDLIVKKDWGTIFSPRWLWGILILCIMLTPMCIGLYQQFGMKGLSFYFWDQSFGRLTGQNEFIQNLSSNDYIDDPFFFYHTFLWLFAPWSILFIVALFKEVKIFINQKAKLAANDEIISWSGFVLIFCVMSMSMYKLPHYIIIALPLAAIVTAKYLIGVEKEKGYRWLLFIHVVLMALLWGICFYLIAISFSSNTYLSITLFAFFLCFTALVFYKTRGNRRLIYLLGLTIVFGNFFLNYHVYPRLLSYQSSSALGRYIHNKKLPPGQIYNFTDLDNALDFYAQDIISHYNWDTTSVREALRSGNFIIVNDEVLTHIKTKNIPYLVLLEKENYRVTLLTAEFLNPYTRASVVSKRYLLKIL